MSRIDVVPADKDKFKVLVNFVQHGISYSTVALANQEAAKLKAEHYPKAEIHLSKAKVKA
jgi:hypothetical protein